MHAFPDAGHSTLTDEIRTRALLPACLVLCLPDREERRSTTRSSRLFLCAIQEVAKCQPSNPSFCLSVCLAFLIEGKSQSSPSSVLTFRLRHPMCMPVTSRVIFETEKQISRKSCLRVFGYTDPALLDPRSEYTLSVQSFDCTVH